MNFEELDYNNYVEAANRSKQFAETAYENGDLNLAYKHYYHASLAFEMAKTLNVDIQKTIFAKDAELLCLQKLDELKRFKKVNFQEILSK